MVWSGMIGLQKYKIGNGFTTCDLSSGHIITMTSLVTPTVQHAFDTFSRFFRESPGVFLVPDKGQQKPLVSFVEVPPVQSCHDDYLTI